MAQWSCSKNHDDDDHLVAPYAAAVAVEEGVDDAEVGVAVAVAVAAGVVLPEQMGLVEAGGS